jgi:hypothetical protein
MKIELIKTYPDGGQDYRVIGKPTNPNWLTNLQGDPEQAWCNVGVSNTGAITSFGKIRNQN